MPYSEIQKISHIRELQRMLFAISEKDERVGAPIPSGVFDKRTAAAVSAFQSIYGLPITGRVDGKTWDAIAAVYLKITATPTALDIFPISGYVDSSSPKLTIEILQSMLSFLAQSFENFPKLPDINGVYDEATKDSVKAAQLLFSLEMTGVADMQTWNLLVEYINFAINRL